MNCLLNHVDADRNVACHADATHQVTFPDGVTVPACSDAAMAWVGHDGFKVVSNDAAASDVRRLGGRCKLGHLGCMTWSHNH